MIINLKSPTDFSGFYIVYDGSTNIEKPGWYGISHLMEHLMCKLFEDLRDDFDRDGVDWNAYTSSNEIVFHFTGLEESLAKYRNIILEKMSQFSITKKQFENEKQIILEEYGDVFNDQTNAHILNLSRKLFDDYDAIGLRSDLENLKFMDCIKFFELQYMNPTKIINVSNKYKFKDDTITFSDLTIDKQLKFGNYETTLELTNEFKDKSSLALLSPVVDDDFPYVKIINQMLGGGLQSPLYVEIREKKGLVYYVNCYFSRVNKSGLTTIMTQTSNKNADQVIDIIKSVVKNPGKYLTKERFETVKSSHIIQKKKDKINRYLNVRKWIDPIEFSVSEIIEDITFKQIKDVYNKYYDFDKFYVSNDRTEFKK
jgi:predicted Zn-dependent peptidase